MATALAATAALPMVATDEAYAATDKVKISMTASTDGSSVEQGKKINIAKKIKVTKGAKVSYASSKKSVATVSKKGVVTAKKPGKVTITVKAKKNGKTATKKVTVKVVKAAAKQQAPATQAPAAQQPATPVAPVTDPVAQQPAAPAAEAASQPEAPAAEQANEPASQPEEPAAEPTAEPTVEPETPSAPQPAAPVAEAASQPEAPAAEPAETPSAAAPSSSTALVAAGPIQGGSASGSNVVTVPPTYTPPTASITETPAASASGSASSTAANTSSAAARASTTTDVAAATPAKNGFVTENGKTYYYKNGSKQLGWIPVGTAKYYSNPQTGVVVTGWYQLSDGDRYFDPKNGGKMVTGKFTVPHTGGRNTYYFNSNGVRMANVLMNGYYYRAGDGVMIANAWQHFSDGDRYFTSDGSMAKGVHTISNNKYYFNSNGIRVAGETHSGYYFRPTDGVGLRVMTLTPGNYIIKSALGGNQCLDVAAASTADTANVQTYAANNTKAQAWNVQSASNGYYTISNLNSNKMLDVMGGSSANGINVHQYARNSSDAQKWLPVSCGGGIVLINKASGKALDVSAGICASGANVQSWDVNCSNAQTWFFEKYVEPAATVTARYPVGYMYGTASEKELAIEVWNAYNDFRVRKGVGAVKWSDECARLAYITCKAESAAGRMEHHLGFPRDNVHSDILQYANWRKSGASAVEKWENSEGHHRMMRNDHGTTEAGIGIYYDGYIWWYTIVYNWGRQNQYEGAL